ncbi:MAG: alpha/beta hydrolase [Desulfobacterales bacterium]|nr:alpha/beta hydrolase [Desulfofustis sp.]NNK93671.1 alpha/beta hydrolase [Desulfobacterales bacterium]
MSTLKRRVIIGIAFAVIILLGVAAFFYRPTRLALERAESFQFRRMQVTQQDEEGTFRFFFITNRTLPDEAGPIEERFSNERKDSLTFGLFDTEIEPALSIGMLVNPTDWFQNEAIQLKRVDILSKDGFLEQLGDQVARSPFRSVLININGFRERFPSALSKTAFLGHVMDIDSPVVTFDWPGNQGSGPRGYLRAQRTASESGAALAQSLRLINEHVKPDRIWIVANSMGAQVVVHAFTDLYKTSDYADIEPEIENVVLTAPDVDRNRFNEQFKQEISALSQYLTVYVSSNDRALLMSRLINRGRRLGESTFSTDDDNEIETASDIFALVEPDEKLVSIVDVTPINRTRNFHNFSLETPEFFDDLYLRLVNGGIVGSRTEYQIETPDGRGYSILTSGR